MRLYWGKAAFFDTKKADGFIKILKIAALEVLISGNLSVCLNIIYCFHGFYGKDSVESAGFFYCPFGFANFAKRFFPSDLIRPLSQRIDPADDPRSVTNPIPTSTLQEKSFSYPRSGVPLASGQSHCPPGLHVFQGGNVMQQQKRRPFAESPLRAVGFQLNYLRAAASSSVRYT